MPNNMISGFTFVKRYSRIIFEREERRGSKERGVFGRTENMTGAVSRKNYDHIPK